MSQRADDALQSFEDAIRERIITQLKRLAHEQVPSDAKFIERIDGDKVFRLRIGDYRATYKIHHHDERVLVVHIAHRSKIYDR